MVKWNEDKEDNYLSSYILFNARVNILVVLRCFKCKKFVLIYGLAFLFIDKNFLKTRPNSFSSFILKAHVSWSTSLKSMLSIVRWVLLLLHVLHPSRTSSIPEHGLCSLLFHNSTWCPWHSIRSDIQTLLRCFSCFNMLNSIPSIFPLIFDKPMPLLLTYSSVSPIPHLPYIDHA